MKFAVLALALLLAVGSHAASLQADAPSALAQIRSAMDVYMTSVMESAKRALDQLDDTEYRELKVGITQRLDEMHTQIRSLQAAVAPVTDNVVNTMTDLTADLRASIIADIDSLKADLEPKRANLKTVIEKHIQEYREKLEPIVTDYYARHTGEMEVLKAKMEPVMQELQGKIASNVEETKAALMPIVESVRVKLSERLQNLKDLALPYVQEYKEQLKMAYSQAQTINNDEIEALRAKIAPLAEDVKAKVSAMIEIIVSSFNKQ